MSARLRQPAINRCLPYRGLHTDLVAHESYYTFNDSATAADSDDISAWTLGSAASVDEADPEDNFNGNPVFWLDGPSGSANVYVQSAVTNLDTALPSTFRVFVSCRPPGVEIYIQDVWLRIYDPNDAGTDAWFHVETTISESTGQVIATVGTLGNTGVDVIEARVVNPIPGMTNEKTGAVGDANDYLICEFELPAAATRTLRIQLVDGNGATTLASSTDPAYIARADVRQGKVSKWTCRRTGRSFSQPDPTKQPYARPMGVPEFNGRRVLKFTNLQHLISDDPATEWAFLTSGAECSIYAAALLTVDNSGYILSTIGFSPTTDGWRISWEGATNEWFVGAYNASATQIFETLVPGSIETLYVLGYRALDGHADGDVVFDLGGTEYVANASNWGAAAPPTNTLYIGGRPPAGNVPFDGYIADIAIYEARLDDEEHARALEEFEAWNASSLSIPSNILCQRYEDGVTESAGAISALKDLSPLDQTIVVSAPIDYKASSLAFRGSPTALSAGTGSCSCAAVGAALTGQIPRCVITTARMTQLNTGGNAAYLWRLYGSSGDSFEGLNQSSNLWRIQRRDAGGSTASMAGSAADLKPHTHSFVTDGTTVQTWIDGVADINTSSNKSVTASDFFWLDAGSTMGDFEQSEIAVYGFAPNTYQRQLVERAQRRRMLGLNRLNDGLAKQANGVGLGYSLGAVAAPVDTSLRAIVEAAGGFMFEFREAGGYTLGTPPAVDAITELITGTSINDAASTAPTLVAAGLDGKDCVDFSGTTNRYYQGVIAAMLAAMQSDAPCTLIVRAALDVVDISSTILGFYDNGGSATRVFGQSATGPGFLRYRTVSDAAVGALASSGTSPDTNPHTYRWEIADAGANVTVRVFVDNVADSANPVTIAKSGSSLLDTVTVGADLGNTNRLNGKIGALVLLPGAPNPTTIAAVEALLAP